LLNSKRSWPIEKNEYEKLVQAKKTAVLALSIEEKFDLLIENYAEYESEMLRLSLRTSLFYSSSWLSSSEDRDLLNRRVVNLLASGSLYVDQLQHDLKSLRGEGVLPECKARLSQEYDNTEAYQIVDSLRNYILHRGLLVHGVRYCFTRAGDSPESPGVVRIEPSLEIERLCEDAKIKPSVRDLMKAKGTKYVNLCPMLRQYVEALVRLHVWVRGLLKDDISTSDRALESVIQKGRDMWGCPEMSGIYIVVDDGEASEHSAELCVFCDLLSRRKLLEKKNRHLERLSNRYVSGSATDPHAS